MPLTILVAARPAQRRFVDTPSRVESWQLLHREADRAYPQLRTVWSTVFSDYKADLDTDAMRAALRSGNLLDVERLIAPAWRSVSEAVRLPLQLLLRETASRSAEAVLPATEATLGAEIAVQFGRVVPEALTAIETYAGTQIVGIGETTLKNVRAVIRSGFEDGRSMTQMMRDLEAFVGLTPRQTEAIETLRQRLLDAGKTRAQAQAQVDRAARRALQLRVENIARTESMYASNYGAYALLTQADRSGSLDPERVKRHWIVSPDERLCAQCQSTRSQNAAGVGLYEPFQTPLGPVMFPPLHPQCRCTTSTSIIT